MANYEEERVKLTNTELNKLKPAAKKKAWTIKINKDIRQLNKGKNKTVYVFFINQKLFRYSPSSVLLNWN